jgi:hypothetical protein
MQILIIYATYPIAPIWLPSILSSNFLHSATRHQLFAREATAICNTEAILASPSWDRCRARHAMKILMYFGEVERHKISQKPMAILGLGD